jgi:hypothetical protein
MKYLILLLLLAGTALAAHELMAVKAYNISVNRDTIKVVLYESNQMRVYYNDEQVFQTDNFCESQP